MAWERKTLTELIKETENSFSTKFYGTAAQLRRGVLKVASRAWAGLRYGADGFTYWAYRNFFVVTADGDQLDRHGAEIYLWRKAATYSSGLIELSGDIGVIIPEGTLFQSADGLYVYQTTEEATIATNGLIQVNITASDAGSNWNADIGTEVSLVSPITNVFETALVVGDGLSGGAELESDDDFRSRILFKKRNPPQGGDKTDYVIWATSVQPVTNATIFPQFPQANSVTVVCANYNNEPPTLTPSEISKVEDYLLSDDIKPVTSDVRVHSVIARTIDVSAKITANNSTTKAAADQELKDLFIRQGTPGATIYNSTISGAINNAQGINGVEIIEIRQDGVVVDDVDLDIYGVAILGITSYQGL